MSATVLSRDIVATQQVQEQAAQRQRWRDDEIIEAMRIFNLPLEELESAQTEDIRMLNDIGHVAIKRFRERRLKR